MIRWSDADPTLLLSSDEAIPDFAFRGQCFVGSDLVIGASGADSFEAQGGTIEPGEDGSYVVLRRAGPESWTLGTDYKGFARIFYHREASGEWAVSNSFLALYRYLVERGHDVVPNASAIAAFSARDMVRTAMSFETPVKGIRLLPSAAVLVLRNGPTPSLWERRVCMEPETTNDYATALARYLTIWTTRLRTLASHPLLDTILHVTGGRDSRTVLAVMLASRIGGEEFGGVRFTSQRNRPDDLAVAENLAAKNNLALNLLPKQPLPPPIDPNSAFKQWAETSVGTYAHMMFPTRQWSARRLVVPGVGGEAHRWVYRPAFATAEITSVAETFRDRFRQQTHFAAWRDSVVEADEYLKVSPAAHPVALVRSHREFRDRFHSGKENFYVPAVLPLASKYLTECSNLLPWRDFKSGQILVDIMYNTARELLLEPYDMPQKMPAPSELRRASDLSWSPSSSVGRVFVPPHEEFPDSPRVTADRRPLSYVLEHAISSIWNRAAIDLLGRDLLADGLKTLIDNVDSPVQNLHHKGRTAHLAYLAATVLPAT